MNKVNGLLAICLIITFCFITSSAQIISNLKIDTTLKGVIGNSLFCDKDYNCGIKQDEKSKIGEFGSKNFLVRAERSGNDFYMQFDTKQNKQFVGDKKIFLKQNTTATVYLKIFLDNKKVLVLPFQVSHNKSEKLDEFNIKAHYAATGILNHNNCSTNIVLYDMNFDGEFTDSDAKRGTNFKLDFNNNNKPEKGEFKRSNEIIEFCNQRFLVSDLNNKSITISPTDLQIAEVGKIVPNFSFDLLNGELITPQKLEGKLYILDFWASWCGPCVKNLSEVALLEKTYKNKLTFYSINIDKKEDRTLAEKIINEKKIYDFTVIRGMGEEDSIWKSFLSINQYIPAYVIVDKDGIVFYAGWGGNDLKELKDKIAELKLEN